MKTLDEVLEAWEAAVEQGENPTATELCAECPELISEAERQIQALQVFATRFGLLADPTAGEPEKSPPARLPVRSVRISTVFQLEKLHAIGGLGSVYLAHDEELNRRVALKFPRSTRLSAATRARFEREARITSQLDHPGIVPVHSIHNDSDGQPCYAMRFIEGQTLQEAIQQFHQDRSVEKYLGPAFRELLRRFQAVCDIVAYTHSRNVIHRDIKPSNIMLGQFGETLLVDWGLAKVQGQPEDSATASESGPNSISPTTTQAGHAVGTAAYASPEQLLGQLDSVNERSDIFSLGATLFSLLTGEHLLESTGLPEHLQRLNQGKIPAPGDRNSAVPVALNAICSQALRVDPAQRYGSPLELSRDIEHYLADEPISIPCESWRVRCGRWLRKHPVLTASTSVGVLVGLMAAVSGSLMLHGRNQQLIRTNAELDETNRSLKQSYNDLANSRASTNVYQAKFERAITSNAQTLKALTALSSEAATTYPPPGEIVTDSDRPFLDALRNRYLPWTSQHGESSESLFIRAMGRLHAGDLSLALKEFPVAEALLADAKQDLLILQAISLIDQLDQCLAQCCALQGNCQRDLGKPLQGIPHWQESLTRFDKLLALSDRGGSRPMHLAWTQRAMVLNSLAEVSRGTPDAALWIEKLGTAEKKLEGLHAPEDHQADICVVQVQCLRTQALLSHSRQDHTAAQSQLRRAIDLMDTFLVADPDHLQIRYQRALCLLDQSKSLLEAESHSENSVSHSQSLDLASKAVQSLALLVAEVPLSNPFQAALSNALELRGRIQKAQGQLSLAAADSEFSELLCQPETVPSEIQERVHTWKMELAAKHHAAIGDAPVPATSSLEQWFKPLRDTLNSPQYRTQTVRLQVEALQLLADLKIRVGERSEAESLLNEAISLIKSHVQDRRSRLLLARSLAELSIRKARVQKDLGQLNEAETTLSTLKADLNSLDLGVTERLVATAEGSLERHRADLAPSTHLADASFTRDRVDRQRLELARAFEEMRQQYIRAGMMADAVVIWERQQRLSRDSWYTRFQDVIFPEPEQGLSSNDWIWSDPSVTYLEVTGRLDGSVWGTGPYTDDSDLATAVVHSGFAKPGESKVVGIRRLPWNQGLSGSLAHGVTSHAAASFAGCYEIIGAGIHATSFYNENYSPASKTHTVLIRGDDKGFAYGTDVYSVDSELSAAAVHAGLVKPQELSFIEVEILPGQESYLGSTRHGVTTQGNGPWHASYRLTRPENYRMTTPR